jgi:Ser/Thr protein kinase RdoA (MazF antagonist)/predicted transcriptional regulator
MNHLVVYKRIKTKNYINWMFDGSKTIDIKFQHNKRFPWQGINKGDILYVKESGGPVVGTINLGEVEFHEVYSWQDSYILLEPFIKKLKLRDKKHLEKICRKHEGKRYLIIFKLKKPLLFNNPVYISKRDQRSWVRDYLITNELIEEVGKSKSSNDLRLYLKELYNLYLPRLARIEDGNVNQSFIVKDGKNRYFLKKYSPITILGYRRNNNFFLQEQKLIENCKSSKINVVNLIKNSKGLYKFTWETDTYALFPFIDGKNLDFKEDLSVLKTFTIMANMHKCLLSLDFGSWFSRTWRGGLFYKHFLNEEFLEWTKKNIDSELKKELLNIKEDLLSNEGSFKDCHIFPIHADIGPHNLLLRNNDIWLVDFDNARLGHLEEDFGISLALFVYYGKHDYKELLNIAFKTYSKINDEIHLDINLINLYFRLMLVRLKYLYRED